MAADAGNVYVNMEEESQAAGNRIQPMSIAPA